MVERVTAGERRAASAARRRVELDDAGDGVVRGQSHRPIGVVGAWRIPWCRHRHAEQPALEPAVLGPRQMPDDACDRQIRRWQQAGRGLLPLEVNERGRCNRSVLIEALHERCALVARLEIRTRQISGCHHLILAGGEASPAARTTCPPPPGHRRVCAPPRGRGEVGAGRHAEAWIPLGAHDQVAVADHLAAAATMVGGRPTASVLTAKATRPMCCSELSRSPAGCRSRGREARTRCRSTWVIATTGPCSPTAGPEDAHRGAVTTDRSIGSAE